MQQLSYRTIAAPAVAEAFRDRGSRFLPSAYPITIAEDIKPIIAALKKEHPKAVHNCYAYRLGIDGNSFRVNDDGEPSGSAGKPILGQIDSMGLTDVLVVITRYFGGTLLGVPGLINAYKVATADVLSVAIVIEKQVERKVAIEFDYPLMGEVLYLLKQANATIHKQELQLFCSVTAGIPLVQLGTLEKLSEIHGVVIKPA